MAHSLLHGLNMPAEFNVDVYNAVNTQAATLANPNDPDNPELKNSWHIYASAWTGVAHRLLSSVNAHDQFKNSIEESTAPGGHERYFQEQALFYCIVSALSSIECFYMAAFGLGTALAPDKFPLLDARSLNRSPVDISKMYTKWLPADDFSIQLEEIAGSTELKQLADLRNTLAHRGILPRQHYLSTHQEIPSSIPDNPKSLAKDFNYTEGLSNETTGIHKDWLMKTQNILIFGFNRFLMRQSEN